MNENDGLVLNVEFQREIEKFRAWMLGINFNLREELNTLSQQITKLENAVNLKLYYLATMYLESAQNTLSLLTTKRASVEARSRSKSQPSDQRTPRSNTSKTPQRKR